MKCCIIRNKSWIARQLWVAFKSQKKRYRFGKQKLKRVSAYSQADTRYFRLAKPIFILFCFIELSVMIRCHADLFFKHPAKIILVLVP